MGDYFQVFLTTHQTLNRVPNSFFSSLTETDLISDQVSSFMIICYLNFLLFKKLFHVGRDRGIPHRQRSKVLSAGFELLATWKIDIRWSVGRGSA